MSAKSVLAVDIGAESGRVIIVRFDGQRLALEECYRFANVPVLVENTLHWDILRLWNDVQAGIRKAGKADSIGIDTSAIDFGLLDSAGHLIGNPVHYRDHRTDGIPVDHPRFAVLLANECASQRIHQRYNDAVFQYSGW